MINHQVLILDVPIIYKINLMLVNSKIIINIIMQAGGIHREGEHLLLICLMIPIKWLILIDKDLLQIIRHKEIKSSKIAMNRMDVWIRIWTNNNTKMIKINLINKLYNINNLFSN